MKTAWLPCGTRGSSHSFSLFPVPCCLFHDYQHITAHTVLFFCLSGYGQMQWYYGKI